MLFMVTETYPTKRSVEVGKMGAEIFAKAPPPHVKRLSFYSTVGRDGIKSHALYELEKGHIDEGFKEMAKAFVPFYSIEGFKITVEPLLSMEEASSLVGLQSLFGKQNLTQGANG